MALTQWITITSKELHAFASFGIARSQRVTDRSRFSKPKGVPSAPNHDSDDDSARVVQSNLTARSLLQTAQMCRLVWLLLASRGTSRGERVEVPVDAVLTFSPVGMQLFLSKEESCGVLQ